MCGQVITFYINVIPILFELYLYVTYMTLLFPGTYHAAVIENRSDFTGRVVVDVGAGSGILSLFAAQVSSSHYLGLIWFEVYDKCLLI